MAETTLSRNKKWIFAIVQIILMLVIANLPPVGQMTEYGMKATACFVGAIFGWMFIDMAWTALILILAAPYFGIITADNFLTSGFGNITVVMILLGYIMFGALNKTQIAPKIAAILLNLKITENRPWVFYTVLVLAAWCCSVLMGGILPILILFPIVATICETFDYKFYGKTSTFLFLAVLLGTVLGQMIIPIRGMALYLLFLFSNFAPNMPLPFLQYMIFTTIFTLLILAIFILFAKFVMRVDLKNIGKLDLAKVGLTDTKFTRKEKFVLIVILMAVVLCLLPSFFRNWAWLTNLGSCGAFVLAIFLFISVNIEDGKPVATLQELGNTVVWDIIFTVIMCVAITNAFSSEEAGVIATITEFVTPVFTNLSPFVFTVTIIMVCMLITNFMNNGATCVMCYPLIMAYSTIHDIPVFGVVSALIIASHLALATPAASVYAQMAFGYKSWIKPSELTKYTFIVLIPVTLVAAVCAVFLINMIF